MDFQKEKREFLGKKDKSRKSSMDVRIKKLVDKVNSLENFFTTSSCSGRILLWLPHRTGRKDKTKWLFTSHDKISFKKIKNKINFNNLPKNDVWFRVDPAILHVASDNIDNAKKLLNLSRDIGFRRAGIISLGKNRVVMELVSTERMDTIISRKGRSLIDENYFRILVNEANSKLEKTWKKISALNKKINFENLSFQNSEKGSY